MICSSCRRTLLSSRLPIRSGSNAARRRQISSAPAPRQLPQDMSLPSSETIPSVTSSNTPGISQPLSTPMLPSTASVSSPDKASTSPIPTKSPKLMGSIPGGATLQGLGYLRAQPIVHAKEDDEYPAWLWTLLKPRSDATSKDGTDVASMTRAARNKYLKKQEKLLQNIPPTIPIHEQSVDLTRPGDSAEVSLQRRQELARSSRIARRKVIKEENFLRGL